MEYTEDSVNVLFILYKGLKSWRWVIALMLVCAIVVNVFGCLLDAIPKTGGEKEEIVYTGNTLTFIGRKGKTYLVRETEEMEKLSKGMTDSEREVVYGTVKSGLESLEDIRDVSDYVTRSLRMQANPEKVPVYQLQYFVDDHYQVEYPIIEKRRYISNILNGLTVELNRDEVVTEIGGILGIDAEYRYLREAIGSSGSGDYLYFSLSYYELTDEQQQAIKHYVDGIIESNIDKIRELYGDFEIKLVNEEKKVNLSTGLADAQRDQNDLLSKLRNQYLAIGNETTLSANQKSLVKALLKESTKEDGAELSFLIKGTEEVHNEIDMLKAKYVAIGLMLGFMAAAAIVCCKVLLRDILMSSRALAREMKVSELGFIKLKDTKKKPLQFIDDWLDRCFYGRTMQYTEEEHIEMICSRIRLYAEKNGFERVALISSANHPSIKAIQKKISSGLAGKLTVVDCERPINVDPIALEQMTMASCVVLVEMIDTSVKPDIRSEVQLCKVHEKPIVGSVVLCA